ncbi:MULTISPECIES: tRNA lysidine(34) synthetase TilS [unclassified Ruegeria]|uniref:tRNA lysidine(34) synthetase TilS n=1 Tax=unclassified Ruegeria TaxID=2625375 RepID=UPI001488444A|nr:MULTISPECIES: tRNA lysidine(34) synthetase TilS [unclassified Ruegeria]
MTEISDILLSEIRARLGADFPARLGIAVSGGGDSVALLHLLKDIAGQKQVALFVATVDHGLRPESATEADWVAQQAISLGVPHETLIWNNWDGRGNLQDRARQERYGLLADWARRNDLGAIALGHTADDQAETILMRLGRAAGVTGLSGMADSIKRNRVTFLRPMLGVTRLQLRDYLTEIGVDWIEDPSNHDMRFDRIKARDALKSLGGLGISAQSLTRVAQNLARADEALALYTQDSARQVLVADTGAVCCDQAGFAALPAEVQRRLVLGSLAWIAGPGYPPRHTATEQAIEAIELAKPGTIGGCILIPKGNKTWICRELNAVKEMRCEIGQDWDDRWVLTGPSAPNATIAPLGDAGLRSVSEWRALGKPREVLVSSPAVWDGETLLSAPLAGFTNGWQAELTAERSDFHSSFLSH